MDDQKIRQITYCAFGYQGQPKNNPFVKVYKENREAVKQKVPKLIFTLQDGKMEYLIL